MMNYVLGMATPLHPIMDMCRFAIGLHINYFLVVEFLASMNWFTTWSSH